MSMMCEAQQETSTGATYKGQDSGHVVQCASCNVQCGCGDFYRCNLQGVRFRTYSARYALYNLN